MNFKADLKDDVLRGLIMADIRAEGLSCSEDKKNPNIIHVTDGKGGMSLNVSKGNVLVKPPSFVNDFVRKNPASRFIISLILLIVIAAYVFYLQLVLIIPVLATLYGYIYYRNRKALKAKYEAKIKVYKMIYKVMIGSIYMSNVYSPKDEPPVAKKKTHPAILFILFLIILFALGAQFIAKELLIMIPLLLFVFLLTNIGIYRSKRPPKPKVEKPKAEEKPKKEKKKKPKAVKKKDEPKKEEEKKPEKEEENEKPDEAKKKDEAVKS